MLQRNEPTIAEQAARWVDSLDHGGETGRDAFAAWLQASPQHVKEFLLAAALDREVDALDLGGFDVEEILQASSGNIVSLQQARGGENKPGRRKRGYWSAGAAATLAAAAVGWWMLAGPGAWENYTTAVGEQRTFELEDGSVVELNPLSRVQTRLTGSERNLRLVAGEAVFKVERDPSRPFRVMSGDTVVRAIGTQFAVHRRSGSVTVSVLEGRVEVSKARAEATRILDAGDEVKVPAAGPMIARVVTLAEQNAAHRRSLTFSGDTLAEIADDFNRYNRAPHIRIEGEALRIRQFSGVFDADDPQSLLDYLNRIGELSIDRTADTIVIRERDRS